MNPFSFLNTIHPEQLDDLYQKYIEYPDSIEPSWRAFFQGFDFGKEVYEDLAENQTIQDISFIENGNLLASDNIHKEFNVIKLIDGYRTRGHLFTKTNPVRERRKYTPNLDIENFGLTQEDLDKEFNAGELIGIGKTTLQNIIAFLEAVFCDAIGIEYVYIRKPEIVSWIQDKIYHNQNHPKFTIAEKKHIHKKLSEAVIFENFLHKNYIGQKRFSLEGNESLIPALDTLIEKAAEKGVKDFVMGMAHRGRLNTLANIFGKDPKAIFNEFEGKDYEQKVFDGDVKYHLGWTCKRKTDTGKEINLNIAPNPSHLEAVGAIVQGIARAKQEAHYKGNEQKVLPIVVHGDAAIAGQGIAYEIVQMAKLDGYTTQGTIHIVVNNQIGFTTNYLDGRSSTYCTDVGKVTLSPVLHVNADDVEAVVHAMQFALEFRMHLQRDVFIDLLGYRKYGHNEGDEPRFTQPKLYKAISKHPNPRDIYTERLKQEGVIDDSFVNDLEKEYKNILEEKLADSKKEQKSTITPIMKDEWEGAVYASKKDMLKNVDTSYPIEKLDKVAKKITDLPKDKKFLRKASKIIDARHKMYFDKNALDWGMAEALAYASLIEEGNDVRMSGQDVERGTFSHRHAVIKAEESEEEIILHNNINDKAKFHIFNSLLSEYAVVGFDYGYAMASPHTLCIWEAQFGDFSNGAQIMIDQYISSAEDKWKTQNGLVMLLPHGYEGQGSEHSSARMERYLQLCGKDNMFIANCSTPANLFHILRRQLKTKFRKPLIIFTPKSLLRHPRALSTKEDLVNGRFKMVIDDMTSNPKQTKSLVFCTGKFYYDILKAKEEKNRQDVALVRIEQLFPFPEEDVDKILAKYQQVEEVVWAQEEPRNMGAYSYLITQFPKSRSFRVCSRRFYSSPAAGSAQRFEKRHNEIIEYIFDKTKDNFNL